MNTSPAGNGKSDRIDFARQNMALSDFVEVHLRSDLLTIRAQYIRELFALKDGLFLPLSISLPLLSSLATNASENIDPDYQLQFGNIAFIDLEPHKLATKLPGAYNHFVYVVA